MPELAQNNQLSPWRKFGLRLHFVCKPSLSCRETLRGHGWMKGCVRPRLRLTKTIPGQSIDNDGVLELIERLVAVEQNVAVRFVVGDPFELLKIEELVVHHVRRNDV